MWYCSTTLVVLISLNIIACCKMLLINTTHLLSQCPWADNVLWCLHSAEGAVGSCYTSHHIWQCDTHNRGPTLWWMVNRLLVEYNLASLHCSWVCGHTASSPQVLTHLPPTVTARASITSHVVHKPPVSTIKSSGTLHKHPTPHEYWPSSTLSGTTDSTGSARETTPDPTHIPTTLGCLKLASPTGLMHATTDPHSWGWTELGQTDSCNLRDPGVIQLQAVLVSFPGS